MRIRRVTAHSFGHLREQTLELADGLTVIYGPNESGKSTWHAALLAALCGRWPARARGEPGIERRRPWTGTDWVVSAEVRLVDGRRVELRHDLEARHGYAKDLDIVADHSAEITAAARGEVPDASRWLGLDRRAFVATACVRQAHLVLATEEAAGVRGYVERAASAAPADETAAAALARIDAFQRDQIGSERSTTRPLPVALRRRAEAADALAAARAGLAALERQAATARDLRAQAEAALGRLRQREAALARAEAQRLRSRAAQARELLDLIGDPAPVAETVPATVAAGRGDQTVGPSPQRASDEATPRHLEPAGQASTALPGIRAAEVAAAVESWHTTLAMAPPEPAPSEPSAPAQPSPSVVGDAPAGGRRRSVALLAAAAVLLVAAGVSFALGWAVAAVAFAVAGVVGGAVGLVHWGRTMAPVAVTPVTEPAVIDRVAQTVATQRREWEQRRAAAEHRVLTCAREVGLPADQVAQAVRELEAWLAADQDRQAARERSAAARARLEALLEGASIADLDAAAARAQQRADELAPTVDSESFGQSTVDADVDTLRREHHEAERRATLAEQALADLERQHTPVAEAEERLAAAEAECQRLAALDDVLNRTRVFLARAQERVHRDIAPHLAAVVGRHLADVTGGRYTEAIVDPGSLAVRVRARGGPLRDVADLSTGTVEQVYLLLRVALAERLVRAGESCPLLLDDVTVHADGERTRRILDVLLAVAARHQVVLFTQQESVREWARARLTDPRHALRELPSLAPA